MFHGTTLQFLVKGYEQQRSNYRMSKVDPSPQVLLLRLLISLKYLAWITVAPRTAGFLLPS